MMIHDGSYRFQLGDFVCVCLSDGSHDYPLNTFFANAPAAEVEAALQQHDLPTDYITTPYTCLLIETKDHRVLVDMGAGKLAPRTGKLLPNMLLAGYDPGSIDTVVITHAHPDHIGGMLDEAGKPNYPNANYYISKDEWDFWFSENVLTKAPEMFVTIARQNLEPIRERVLMVEKEQELVPGICALLAPGHTPGHMVVEACFSHHYLMYISDTVLHTLHLEHPDWLPIYDLLPESASASKQTIFDRAADHRALVVGQHFHPFPSLGVVVKREEGWQWQPI
jgi:glyoxylase-like metal-dependent hydrolase (beta-lactamase superfamily II)